MELIKEGKPTLGTRVLISWPGIFELIGQTELFDYVEFVAEYAPWTLYDLENIARVCELYNMSSMIKLDAVPRSYIAAKALQSGIQNFLFSDIRNVKDAEDAVKSVKLEPEGIMGIGNFRVGGYVFDKFTVSDYRKYAENIVVAFMIEKRSAVDQLEEILSVQGVDMVQFGPWDYGLSIDLAGPPETTWALDNPKVKEAELKCIKTAIEMGKRPRVELSDVNLKSIEQYIKLGVKDFSLGIDIRILYNFWKEKGQELRKILLKLK
ncbi:MAG: aldolase/citrate lyase family protein [Thermoproteota archaeon]|nr:2,4-dihydroxyhept-2-ene-1,7-dioic acid aldolase [Candidatus Brockarchaeota archaeon]MBO3800829.1 2,4-dihydroxyhept-2-ene-1,7-dioic acid aldolase [Candidatus Brockarchaeota archaeon]